MSFERVSKWDKQHTWYLYSLNDNTGFHTKQSFDGVVNKPGVIGWFNSEKEALQCKKYLVQVANYTESLSIENNNMIDISGLTEEEAIAKVRQAYKKSSWIDDLAKSFANINHDEALCYYVGFDETEDVDDRPILKSAVRYGANAAITEFLTRLKDLNLLGPITTADLMTVKNDMGL